MLRQCMIMTKHNHPIAEQSKQPHRRYMEIDALRGIAVIGILAMNIISFAMPEIAYSNPKYFGGYDGINISVWAMDFIVIDGKMRGIFALLFGASMILFSEKALEKGRNEKTGQYSRLFWLAIIGLIHLYVIWYGDILFSYACIGVIAFQFRRISPENLIKIALIIYALGVILYSLIFGSIWALSIQANLPGADPKTVQILHELFHDFGASPEAIKDSITLYHSDFTTIFMDKINDGIAFIIAMLLLIILEILPLMLIGMALYKSGFLTGQWDIKKYWSMGIFLVIPGAILSIIMAIILYVYDFDFILSLNIVMAWSAIPRLMMTLGYVALFLCFIIHYQHHWLTIRFAATGRMAFTNYLMTSIMMTAIFYGWGFGLFGTLSRVQLVPIFFAMAALMLLWSLPWLKRFNYGPLEWLWRGLSRREIPKILRAS